MVSLSHKVSEGFSEQVAFKGVTGEAKEAVRAVWGGDNFRQRENRSTALRQHHRPFLNTFLFHFLQFLYKTVIPSPTLGARAASEEMTVL